MTTPKDLVMITVTRCFWAAGVVLVATALSAAGDSPGVTINSDRTSALLPGEELAGYDAGRLESSRPYERGKVPVVFVHGLWGSPRNWDRMIARPRGRPCTPGNFSSGRFATQAVTPSSTRPTCCGSPCGGRVESSIPTVRTQPSTEWSSWATALAASWRR